MPRHGVEFRLATIVLLLVLGGVFLMGFSEAVGVAIPLVAVFLLFQRRIVEGIAGTGLKG